MTSIAVVCCQRESAGRSEQGTALAWEGQSAALLVLVLCRVERRWRTRSRPSFPDRTATRRARRARRFSRPSCPPSYRLASLFLSCFPHSRKMPNVNMLTRPQSALPGQPGLITLSPEEKAAGKWSRANLQRAMELMHRDGVLAVAGVVDIDHVKALREAMDPVARKVAASKTKLSQFNQGFATNFLMSPLLTNKDLLFDDVYANRFVHSLIEAYLGPDIKIHLCTANVAMPRTQDRQRVHKDLPWIHPLAPFIVNLNLLLCGAIPSHLADPLSR